MSERTPRITDQDEIIYDTVETAQALLRGDVTFEQLSPERQKAMRDYFPQEVPRGGTDAA